MDAAVGAPPNPMGSFARGAADPSAGDSAGAGADPFLPAPSLPSGGGAIRGIGEKFQVNPARGTCTLTVPLPLSPGRAGFTPALALGYESGSGNGPFGLGFDLAVPHVARKTDKGVPRYDDSDVYLLSDAEDLVPSLLPQPDGTWLPDVRTASVDGTACRVQRYRPRVDTVFSRVERCERLDTGEVFWRTVSGDNHTSVFGRSAAARVADPADPSRVAQWLLEEVRDDRGNVAVYEYKPEDLAGVDPTALHERHRLDGPAPAGRYLKQVRWGNHTPGTADPACFLLVLDYGEHDQSPQQVRPWTVRADAFSDYRGGFEVRTWRLCHRILMFHSFPQEFPAGPDPRLVRSLDLTYDTDSVATKLVSVTSTGYDWDATAGAYRTASLPPLEFAYTTAAPDSTVHDVGTVPVPEGDGPYWVDLDGEGIPGALSRAAGGWWYQPNLGGARLDSPRAVPHIPSAGVGEHSAGTGSGQERLQLADLGGDGRMCLVRYTPTAAGAVAREPDGAWSRFRPFLSAPVLDFADPGVRFADLAGDGLADVLVGTADGLLWHRSLGTDGYSARHQVAFAREEESGPPLPYIDATGSVLLADMSGDGLPDLVRVRDGEICYWPNLGHGRFGAKVLMDSAPVFDHVDVFDPRRVRLGDVDGSGPADLVYLGRQQVRWWPNLAGNGFGAAQVLDAVPPVDALTRIDLVDLLGTGTSCLVWASPLHRDAVRYLDLSRGTDTTGGADPAGRKPRLLTGIRNNFGAETTVQYAASTAFYLADRDSGDPARAWVTRLPFPVQVVASTSTAEAVSGTASGCRYSYRHGHFDGAEREFRGFGMVQTQDTQTFPASPSGDLATPPVRTRSWFHTGGYSSVLTDCYAADALAVPLPGPVLDGLAGAEDYRQALRALAGAPLRTEVYADDATAQARHPYSVTEHRYRVLRLQPAADPGIDQPAPHTPWTQWAAFTKHELETVVRDYERDPADPRTSHSLTLEVDDYGVIRSSAAVGYRRRTPEIPEQQTTSVTWTSQDTVNTDTPDTLRLGVPIRSRIFEVTGLPDPGSGRHSFEAVRDAVSAAAGAEIPYEATPPTGAVHSRCVEQTRTRYWSDDLTAALPAGQVGVRALPHHTERVAFTPGLLTAAFGTLADAALLTEGGYVLDDGLWWAPSGVTGFDAAAFYLPRSFTSPFGNVATVDYDPYALLPVAGHASHTAPFDVLVTVLDNDYRVLGPRQVTEANGNRGSVAFDPLGMVTASWVRGKAADSDGDPDSLPGTVFTYDPLSWYAGTGPVWAHAEAREQHGDPAGPWQRTRVYTDGLGRTAMTKTQAEPGLAWELDGSGKPILVDTSPEVRWIGSGRVVYTDKGLPAEQYEPYFSASLLFESADALVKAGVTTRTGYDPLGRAIRVDFPDGTFERTEFDPWRQTAFDAGDTVLDSRWYLERSLPGASGPDQRAAHLAAAYANTPAVAILDALGRTVRTREDNGPAGVYETRITLDIEGATRSVADARGVTTLTQITDLRGHVLYARSADAGERRQLTDCGGAALRSWDAVGTVLRLGYDLLRRPVQTWVRDSGAAAERLVDLTVWGEQHPQAAARNLRGRAYRRYDEAGLATSERHDFKGNLLAGSRTLAVRGIAADWTPLRGQPLSALDGLATTLLDAADVFTNATVYDALNRPVTQTLPDGTRVQPRYSQAGLLTGISASLGSATSATTLVTGIEHDAMRRRQQISYAGGTVTDYTYDPDSFALSALRTTTGSGARTVQDLTFTYDAVRNITEVGDAAQQTVFFAGAVVPPVTRYTYDPVYRLSSATGREHAGLGVQPDNAEPSYAPLPHPNDANALRSYTQTYAYDAVGNIQSLTHAAGPAGSYTRRYAYASDSNRLLSHTRPADAAGSAGSAVFVHDADGRMTTMAHLPGALRWDHTDRLSAVDLGGGGSAAYAYNFAGQRVRKTVTRAGGLVEEHIYLGGFEIFRRHRAGLLVFERTTVHVDDGSARVAMVETVTVDTGRPGFDTAPAVRLQIGNHLGSAVLELTDTAQVISYEEYHPFGSTALWLAAGQAEVSRKRYRYTGKEKDEETGLYYHGARYYASWLARWTSCDPKGAGTNGYRYCSNRPTVMVDPDGAQGMQVVPSPMPRMPPPMPPPAPPPTPLSTPAPAPPPTPTPVGPATGPSSGPGLGPAAGPGTSLLPKPGPGLAGLAVFLIIMFTDSNADTNYALDYTDPATGKNYHLKSVDDLPALKSRIADEAKQRKDAPGQQNPAGPLSAPGNRPAGDVAQDPGPRKDPAHAPGADGTPGSASLPGTRDAEETLEAGGSPANDRQLTVFERADIMQQIKAHKPLTTEQKNLLRSEARWLWRQATQGKGPQPGGDNQLHHLVPLEFAHLLDEYPNLAENLKLMQQSVHSALHTVLNNGFKGLPVIVNPGRGYKSPNKPGKPAKAIDEALLRAIRTTVRQGWPGKMLPR